MAIAEIHVHQKPAILTENLTKRYGDLLAVDHISFQVNEGEIFGFLGPNGSGKTSTIRMLVGLSQPEEGRASVLGYHLPAEISQAKRYVGVVPDASNLYDELSAQDNLLLHGPALRRAARRAKIEGRPAPQILRPLRTKG